MLAPPGSLQAGLAQVQLRLGLVAPLVGTDLSEQVGDGGVVTVTIDRSDGRRQTFRIVGEDEADPAHGTISHASPLARSLFGKSVGDVVRAGADDAEITEIR